MGCIFVEFPSELSAALQGRLDLSGLLHLADEMFAPFIDPDPKKRWREGTQKCCFNYLLLDPRVTQNLPVRIKTIGLYCKVLLLPLLMSVKMRVCGTAEVQ